MKQILFLFSFTVLITCKICAQEEEKSIFQPAIIAGFNATQVAGDNLAGYRKLGFNGGAGAFVHFAKKFSASFEILYSNKGSSNSNNEIFVDQDGILHYSYKLVLDYIELPFLINFHDKEVLIAGVGIVYTNLVRYKEFRGGLEYIIDNPYKLAGVEGLISITFVFKKALGFNLRYAYSLADIRKIPVEYKNGTNQTQRNNVVSIRLMYLFKR